MSENPRRGRQARNFTTNAENSRSQIVFRTDIFPKIYVGCPWRVSNTVRIQNLSRDTFSGTIAYLILTAYKNYLIAEFQQSKIQVIERYILIGPFKKAEKDI